MLQRLALWRQISFLLFLLRLVLNLILHFLSRVRNEVGLGLAGQPQSYFLFAWGFGR